MASMMLNEVELTVLSLVAEGARYGGEIEQLIEQRGLREWLIVGSASFYYILTRLEQQALLTRTQNPGDNDLAHAVFQVTDAGRGVVQTGVADLLCQPRSLAESFAVGLANIGVLKPQQADRALAQHRESLMHRLQMAESLWARHQSEKAPSESMRALYTHGIALMRAELDWLEGFLHEWRERHSALEHDGVSDSASSTPTPRHLPTANADKGKQIQKLKRPKAE